MESLGYPRRLHHRADFLAFFRGSKQQTLSFGRVFHIPNSLGHFRLGITLKVKASSVQRNKIKRAIRESMRQSAAKLGSRDYNVVIHSQQKAKDPLFYRELFSEIRKTFQ